MLVEAQKSLAKKLGSPWNHMVENVLSIVILLWAVASEFVLVNDKLSISNIVTFLTVGTQTFL